MCHNVILTCQHNGIKISKQCLKMSTYGRNFVTFGVNFDSDACSEHTSVQSIRRFRAYAGSEHTSVQAYKNSEHAPVQAYTNSEHTTVQACSDSNNRSVQAHASSKHAIVQRTIKTFKHMKFKSTSYFIEALLK